MNYPNPMNPYGSPYNNIQELYNIRDKMDQQIRNIEQYNQQRQNQIPQTVNQTFQITPNQNIQNGSDFDCRSVQNDEEVRNALTMRDSIFVNKDMTILWTKNIKGDIRSYSLKEIVNLDPKDQKIQELENEIEKLKEAMGNGAKSTNNGYANEYSKGKKSSGVQQGNSNNAG